MAAGFSGTEGTVASTRLPPPPALVEVTDQQKRLARIGEITTETGEKRGVNHGKNLVKPEDFGMVFGNGFWNGLLVVLGWFSEGFWDGLDGFVTNSFQRTARKTTKRLPVCACSPSFSCFFAREFEVFFQNLGQVAWSRGERKQALSVGRWFVGMGGCGINLASRCKERLMKYNISLDLLGALGCWKPLFVILRKDVCCGVGQER